MEIGLHSSIIFILWFKDALEHGRHLKKQYAAWTTSSTPGHAEHLPPHLQLLNIPLGLYIYMESSKQKIFTQFSVREQRRKPALHEQSALHRPPSQSIRNERLHSTAPSCISLMITVIVQNNAAQSNFWIYLASSLSGLTEFPPLLVITCNNSLC